VIERGVFHLVVVPDDAPDLRRHWHRGCWDKELRRRGITPLEIGPERGDDPPTV
jgi:hypothetical protein